MTPTLRLRLFPLRQALTALALAATCLTASCALYRNDRCFLEDDRYAIARGLFIESGSLDLTQRQLKSFQWLDCEINEAVYRLQKEFEVIR